MLKKVLFTFIILAIGVMTSLAANVETYIVVNGCSALNLDEGDIVKVAIPEPNSTTTRISVVNGFKSEFIMEPARGGMARAGGNGYSSCYTINGKNVFVQRNHSYIIVGQGAYSFKLRKR